MANATHRTIGVPVKVDERPELNLQDRAKRYPMVIAVDRDAKVLRLYKNLQLECATRSPSDLPATKRRRGVTRSSRTPSTRRGTRRTRRGRASWPVPGDPRNPLAARWLGIADGQGIHGTKDIESLGSAASHGCVHMSVKAVKELYRQVKGTPVFLQ